MGPKNKPGGGSGGGLPWQHHVILIPLKTVRSWSCAAKTWGARLSEDVFRSENLFWRLLVLRGSANANSFPDPKTAFGAPPARMFFVD